MGPDGFELAVCQSLEANQIVATLLGGGGGADNVDFWRAEQDAISIEAGQTFTTADVAQLAVVGAAQEPEIDGPNSMNVIVRAVEPGTNLVGAFVMGPDFASQSGWLQTDGAVTRVPCEGDYRK